MHALLAETVHCRHLHSW